MGIGGGSFGVPMMSLTSYCAAPSSVN